MRDDKSQLLGVKLIFHQALREASAASGHGGNSEAKSSSLILVEADEMVDALKPNGLYTVRGEDVELTLRLIRNRETLKILKVTGKVNEKEKLINQVVKIIEQSEF